LTATLSRPGIFKARPVAWSVKQFDSGSVAINMKFLVLAELDGKDWLSWSEYEEHHVYGDWFVVKKDGTINTDAVEQLVACIGWDASLGSIVGSPPDVVVQISVKPDEYRGETRYKASWMNPEDFVPAPQGESPEEVRQLDARFGSLLRAAAGAAKAKPKAAKPKPATVPPSEPSGPAPLSDDGRPMVQNPISGEWEPLPD